jgi:multimeric flavodoxin WrbA
VVRRLSKMHILCLNGSPRRGGNTDTVLKHFIEGASSLGADVETLFLRDFSYSPCVELYACRVDGKCALRDDMDAIYPKLEKCDMLVVASPIFFYALPAHLKALIDRCQANWIRKYVIDKNIGHEIKRPGIFIGIGATGGKNLFRGPIFTIKYFFDALDVRYEAELLLRGLDLKDDAKKRPEILGEARGLGLALAEKHFSKESPGGTGNILPPDAPTETEENRT